ncbi:DUF4174 domain-containing protein [Halomonas sp. WWR20]
MSSRPCVLTMLCLLLWSALAATASAADPANPLMTDRSMFRALILVTPSAEDDAYRRMQEQLRQREDDIAQRRLMLYRIEAGKGQRAGRPMTPFETRALLNALDLDPQGPLTVVLVGLDGGKKMQLEGYVAPQQIFDVIDNIAIRQPAPRSDALGEDH